MNNTSLLEALRHAHRLIENNGDDADFLDKHLEAAIAEQAKPQEPVDEMTWEEFAKISYEAATQYHNDRVTHDGFKIAAIEFYELSGDKIEAWTHGCAVGLAAYKNLAPPALEPISEEEIREMAGEENCLLLNIQFEAFKRGVRATEAHHNIGVKK